MCAALLESYRSEPFLAGECENYPSRLDMGSEAPHFPGTALTVQIIKKIPAGLRYHLSPAKRICVFEHSVMTNFNCECPAIQRGQGSGFLSEGSS